MGFLDISSWFESTPTNTGPTSWFGWPTVPLYEQNSWVMWIMGLPGAWALSHQGFVFLLGMVCSVEILSIVKYFYSKLTSPTVKMTGLEIYMDAPKVYTRGMDVGEWLIALDEYLESQGIKRDLEKTQILLSKVDTSLRALLKNLVDANKRDNYETVTSFLRNSQGVVEATTGE